MKIKTTIATYFKKTKRILTNLVLLFILTFGAAACQSNQTSQLEINQLNALNGTYIDPIPYEYGQGVYGKREFTFKNGSWTLDFVLALDPKLNTKVFRFRTLGSYEILRPSANLPQAYEANFKEDKKFVTLLTQDKGLAQAFGLMSCSLAIGIEKDISKEGCSLWKSVKDCPIDHDLVKLDKDGKLYFGVRPKDNNMCKEEFRPTSLTPPTIRM
ncbi:MAG: hypothetical protein CK427_05295 [Leptospira sp.]|nr:MAG: hypothetical protein CK427_05295 [Leptospira sp.]